MLAVVMRPEIVTELKVRRSAPPEQNWYGSVSWVVHTEVPVRGGILGAGGLLRKTGSESPQEAINLNPSNG